MYPTQSNGFEDSVGRRYYDEHLYSRVPDFLDLIEDYANSDGVPPNIEINADYHNVHCNGLSMTCQDGLDSNLHQNLVTDEPAAIGDIPINESNLEILPNAYCRSVEEIKQYLMEDIPDTCPAYLPILGGYGKSQNPLQFSMQSNKTDMDAEKTYLSFEDVNEVMSGLSPSNGISRINEVTSIQTTGMNANTNSFLSHLLPSDETPTCKTKSDIVNFSHHDTEIESTIKSNSLIIEFPPRLTAPAAIPKVVDFCPEQTAIKTNVKDIEIELNNSIIEVTPVSKQCDEIETLNTKKRKTPVVKRKVNRGKNLYENFLTNSTILDFKDRTCKSKKVVYYDSSDEETEDKNIKNKKVDDEEFKTIMKPPVQSNYRKKLSPPLRKPGHKNEKNSNMVINNACEASNKFNQNFNSSIKLIIRNKSQVIIKSNGEDSQKVKNVKFKNNASEKPDNLKEKDSSPKHVQPPQALQPKIEKRSFDHDRVEAAKKKEQPRKKQKLNIQEYKLKQAVSSNNSAAQVNKKLKHADIPDHISQKASMSPIIATPLSSEKLSNETKDLVKQQILMKIFFSKKKKREEIPSQIPKEKNVQLQPLMSEAEVIKIVDPTNPIGNKKPQLQADYEQNAVASVEVNTEQNILEEFKQTVDNSVKRDKKSPMDEKKHTTIKIDNESCKNIRTTIKKQVETKISSNIVMKKAPEKHGDRHSKLRSPVGQCDIFTTTTVRDYDPKAVPEADKMIQDRHKYKQTFSSAVVQTNSTPEFAMLASSQTKVIPASRRCNDGNMSLSSAVSPARTKEILKEHKQRKSNERVLKSKDIRSERLENDPKEKKRSRSKGRSYRRRSRSVSRGRKSRSRSRSLSRCRDRYPTSRAKLRSRSPYYKRRSPSVRHDRSEIPRSHSGSSHQLARPYARFKIPLLKPQPVRHMNGVESTPKSLTPPFRKSTISASSSSSLSSYSGSHSSSDSRNSNQCNYKRQGYTDYSSEDRQVEERRIVFVGRLERDIDKTHLRNIFSKFGVITEIRLLRKQDGSRYGFVTYRSAHEAWLAVDSAARFPQYDIDFGGRRDFYRRGYTDFDGIEAMYTEREFFGAVAPPVRRNDDNSFEQMLGEVKKAIENKKTRRIMKTDDYSSV